MKMNEVSAEKVNNLRDIILNRAGDERKSNLARGHKDAEAWLARENEKLQHEVDLVLQDARKRAEDIRRRQILSAERDKSTETLRLQNRILSEAMGRLQDKLVRLRDREDYADILAGMCIEAAEMLGVKTPLKLRLAADPAPILGGCWVITADGHKQVDMDWQSVTQEHADTLAERLLPLL